MEESSTDDRAEEEAKPPTKEETMITSWFWKGNKAIIEAADKEESRLDIEDTHTHNKKETAFNLK